MDKAVSGGNQYEGVMIMDLTRLLLNRPTRQLDLAILRTNMVQCGGPLPGFGLPGPWNHGSFANDTELCAITLASVFGHSLNETLGQVGCLRNDVCFGRVLSYSLWLGSDRMIIYSGLD